MASGVVQPLRLQRSRRGPEKSQWLSVTHPFIQQIFIEYLRCAGNFLNAGIRQRAKTLMEFTFQ